MRLRQLSDLQNDVLVLLDEVGSGKPAEADLTEPLNQAWAKLYRRITNAGEHYYLALANFSTSGGTNDYPVPSDYLKTVGLDVQISGTQFFPAHRMQFEQRNDYQLSDWSWPRRILYDIWGQTVHFVPTPGGAFNCRHYYYPAPLRMTAPSDSIDGIDGAELAMVYLAAANAALSLEQWEMADRLEAKVAAEWAEIEMGIRDRNVGEAPMARVVRGRPATRGFRTWWR